MDDSMAAAANAPPSLSAPAPSTSGDSAPIATAVHSHSPPPMLGSAPKTKSTTSLLRQQRVAGKEQTRSHRNLSMVAATATVKLPVSLIQGSRRASVDATAQPQPRVDQAVDSNVHKFEQMMDRFQLRRMQPVAKTPSAHSEATSRIHSVQDIDVHRSGGLPLSGAVAKNQSSSDASGGGRAPGPLETEMATGIGGGYTPPPATAAVFRVSSIQTPTTKQPWGPTSWCTQVRLAVLVAVFAMQFVYVPYSFVYVPHHARAWDWPVDAVYMGNLLAVCNTATRTRQGHVVTTRRAIWRHYRRNGFARDLLAALPIELGLVAVDHDSWFHSTFHLLQLLLRCVCLWSHVHTFQMAWSKKLIGADKSPVAWLFYSRYSHLVRISGIVVMITLMAHHLACLWSWLHLQENPDFLMAQRPLDLHLSGIYDALQLLQGQGVPTTTPTQNIFGSIAVLLGSIILAVVFGHVAILVANFQANATLYQRKMERVFAIMGKLQLPHPIRERVHQYYEYLHAEYESLDGEIVTFAKDLSHTLELEVVLFKYMDVLMNVPHWSGCSPDFQKQLVLHLSVRVYLPDDFVMRRGEVGTECYIINRGTCKLCVYPGGSCEKPSQPLSKRYSDSSVVNARNVAVDQPPAVAPPPPPLQPGGSVRKGRSRFSINEGISSDLDVGDDNNPYSHVTELQRGQAIGELSLLANYERSSDVRAATYVEMCVLTRDMFQKVLARYPRDREQAITSIVGTTMTHLAEQQMPCILMKMARDVRPNASLTEGISMVVRAMNRPVDDPSISFGLTQEATSRLHRNATISSGVERPSDHAAMETAARCGAQTTGKTPTQEQSRNSAPGSTTSFDASDELMDLLRDVAARVRRIEDRQIDYDHRLRCLMEGSPGGSPVGSQVGFLWPHQRRNSSGSQLLHKTSTDETAARNSMDNQRRRSSGSNWPFHEFMEKARWKKPSEPKNPERPSPSALADQLFAAAQTTGHAAASSQRSNRVPRLRRTNSLE